MTSMITFLRSSAHRTWLLLVLATVTSFEMRTSPLAGTVAGVAILAIAYLKGRLVVLDFMELRHAARVWRFIFEGWLLVISIALMAMYGLGAFGVASA
mgnify:CR=1 FL=1